MTNESFLSLDRVSKSYRLDKGGEFQALRDVSFSVAENDMIALVGPSGCGKSTALRIISGLIPPTSGSVVVHGAPLQGINLDVSLVFQDFALFPWLTVFKNIALGLEPLNLGPDDLRMRIKRVVDLVGLEGFEEAYPRELSGSMKQRVGIARALAMERPLLLMDEPFSALDVLTAETLRAEVQKILLDQKTATRAMIVVTHNIAEAVFMARRIFLMGINPGRIRGEIVNDLPFPRDDQSERFRQLVQRVHAMVTDVLMPDQAPGEPLGKGAAVVAPPQVETLPNVSIGQMIGLLESLMDQGGTANIFEMARRTEKEFGTTLFVVKAAEILDLVDTPRQLVILTPLGRRFVAGDINARKQMLHETFKSLHLVQMITAILRLHDDLRMPVEDLTVCVREWMPTENPHEVIEALVSFGRFAEYFGYNDDTKLFYLDVGQETA